MADKSLDNALKGLETEFKNAIDRADNAATERLNTAIDEMKSQMREIERAANRPVIGAEDPKFAEHKNAFVQFLRDGNAAPLSEFKAMTAGSSADGGYTVPKIIDNAIMKQLVDISPLRQVARVLSVSTTDYHIPFSKGGTASGWVGETDTRTNTATSQFADIVPPMGELYAWTPASQTIIEDSQFDIPSYIAGEVATEFARAEGAAFIAGSGTKQPSGLLNVTTAATDDATRAFGTVQTVTTGTTATITADDLIALIFKLKAGYRAGSSFLMSKAVLGTIRGLKDAYGQYLWVAGLGGTPDTLMGYPIYEAEDMTSAVATGNLAVAFGNFQRAYTIVDRVGMSVIVDPYTAAPYTIWKSRKRVGGTVVDTSAYKILKVK